MLYDTKWDKHLKVKLAMSAAADYIEKHGWCQHHFDDETGAVCILGAIVMAADGYAFEHRNALAEHRNALADRLGMPGEHWNDAPGRTKAEVIDFLRNW